MVEILKDIPGFVTIFSLIIARIASMLVNHDNVWRVTLLTQHTTGGTASGTVEVEVKGKIGGKFIHNMASLIIPRHR